MDNARTAVVFVNRLAGRGRAARKLPEVRAALAEKGVAAEFCCADSSEEFRREVRAALAAGWQTLVAMGGDGTLQLLVREALGSAVNFGVIPLGGGNDFAAALGIRCARQAVEVIGNGSCRQVDVLRVRFRNGEQAAYLGGGGVGLDAEAARHASGRFLKWPGRWRYLAATLAALRRFPGVPVEVEFPDSPLPGIRQQALLAAVLNTPAYGGGLRLAPDAQLDDGLLEFVMVGMLGRAQVMRSLFWLMATGELRTAQQERRQARSVRLLAPPGALFHGDGEILGRLPLEIEVLPRALRMLAPPAAARPG
jgi:diacylglycerol kinase (ATP)